MIAHINKEYLLTCDQEWVALLISTLARNNHLVDCGNETKEFIEQCVRKHCSTIEIEFIRNAPLYEITLLKRKHLTTIEVDGSFSQNEYLNLFGEPSLVLLENAPYEWPVYIKMMIYIKKIDSTAVSMLFYVKQQWNRLAHLENCTLVEMVILKLL